MSSSQISLLAVGIMALSVPAVVIGQSAYSTLGSEYRIAGALPGDQVKPAVSVGAGGGYVVWQDNATDGDGWGISAQALNSSFHAVSAKFRVNATAKWDQENPQVALLNNGGAVFVWQGGRQGFQHIYARFLSSSNSWGGLDQMVNTATKVYQGNPAVTVLSNGNVVVVYATYNGAAMQDVYGQIFSPDGVKIGAEFQVNDFTAYNQRSPSVAAFNEGFVTTWVSEQQRTVGAATGGTVLPSQFVLPSVDVYARVFDAVGNPAADEFVVNSASNVCANPVVAATDGGVLFAWSGTDTQVRGNSWDVYSRPYTFSGTVPLGGIERRVNTQLYGDQFRPAIGVEGTNELVVWTSIGQDGSAEGVFGQFLKSDGAHVGDEFRVNSTTFAAQQEPTLAADHAGRLVAVWTSPTYSTSRNDLFAQTYASANYTPSSSVTNYDAPAFVGDPAPVNPPEKSNGGSYTAPYYEVPTLEYPGTVSHGGSDIPPTNAFALASGTYSGLFYENAGISSSTAGYISVRVNKNASFSGSVLIGGRSYSLGSGKFDDLGATTKIVARPGASSLVVSLQLDLFGANQIRGTVKSGDRTSTLLADRQTASASGFAGSYTMVIPGGRTGPEGSSYGTVTITGAGLVRFSGKLSDGTPVTQSSTLSTSGVWPLYFNKNETFLISWIQMNATPPANVSGGDLIWIKAAQTSRKLYASGFTNELSATVELTAAAAPGSRIVTMSGGGLETVENSVQVATNHKVVGKTANIRSLNLQANGTFAGSMVVGGKAVPFQGALLNGNSGEGYFLYGNLSGKVKIE